METQRKRVTTTDQREIELRVLRDGSRATVNWQSGQRVGAVIARSGMNYIAIEDVRELPADAAKLAPHASTADIRAAIEDALRAEFAIAEVLWPS